MLTYGHGGRQTADDVAVRLRHLAEKLPRVGRQALHIATLPLRVERVEGQGRFARARETGDDDKFVAGNVYGDILEVVDPYAL